MTTPQRLLEHALATSTSAACIAVAHAGSTANLRWANNTLTTNGETRSLQVTVIAFDHRPEGVAVGSVSSAAATLDQVAAITEQADAAARASAPAEDAAELVTTDQVATAAADWDDPPATTTFGVFGDFAPALGEAFGRAEAGGRLLYGYVEHDVTTTYLASSSGLRLRHAQPTGHVGCTGKDTGLTRSAWHGAATTDFTDVDALAIEAELARRLEWGRRTESLPAGRYDTILPPGSVADLLVETYWSAGARVAADGQSVFSSPSGGTRIGEQVAAAGVHLTSDPADPAQPCEPFTVAAGSSNTTSVFDNGMPLRHTDWIRDGRLTALLQTRHSARLTGNAVTPMIDNLTLRVDTGTGTTEDLVAGMDDGLLLTCLWYIRDVDPQTLLLTGLTRDGVYRVRNGEIVGAVNNFRFNESPVDLLNRFSHASAPTRSFSREWGDEYFNRTVTPALRVPDFNMSSVSRAM